MEEADGCEPIESSMFSGKRSWNVVRWIAPMGRAFLLVLLHSMSNVETDRQMLDGQTVNSLEIVGVRYTHYAECMFA